jgi:hypothetical protein
MHRIVHMAAVAAIALSTEPSLALSVGGGAGSLDVTMSRIIPVASHVAPNNTGGATPNLKKLSPKAGAACFRACMKGMGNSAGWGNFCDYSCYGP